MKKYLAVLTVLALLPILTDAQANRWKRTRYELVGGLGVSTFVGDLGGGNKPEGKHFLSDYDFMSQRFVLNGGLRYKLLNSVAVQGVLSYAMLAGNDNKTENIYRKDRNLSFRTNLWELSTHLEYSIIPEPLNYRRNRRGHFSLRSLLQINTYVFAGVSVFYFNPKGKDDTGEGATNKWVALQPLGTEGQGLVDGRKKYSRVQVAIPFGMGFKYAINRKMSVGLEFGPRYTFTDYIDDVSTTYVDNEWLREKRGDVAARLADKSIKTNPENPDSDPVPNVNYGGGDQRGEAKFNDFYMFTTAHITYKLTTGRNGLPKF